MDELEQLRAATARHEAECHSLEQALGALHPGKSVPGLVRRTHDGRVAIDSYGVNLRRYEQDELGNARARRDVLAARAEYLRERWETLRARAARQAEAAERARLGLGRFTAGTFTLDRLTDTAKATPGAFAELQEERVNRQHAHREAEVDRVAQVLEQKATG